MLRYLAGIGILAIWTTAACAADWPTYMHDNTRSGITDESLAASLSEVWVYKAQNAPRPAWPAPAKQDFWHGIRELRPEVTYDRAYHAVVAGDRVYFGSSADDKVYCLDATTGQEVWSFFAGGPVRLAPTIADGRVYFGSDDGCVYCLDAAKGKLEWKHRSPASDRRIPGNGRVISYVPARTGVIVDNGVCYYASGLFPPDSVFLFALKASNGDEIWSQKPKDLSPQGYMLASSTRLYFPTGRTSPAMVDRENGETLASFEGPGGAYALVVDDGVVSGPGRRQGNDLSLASPEKPKETLASFPGVRMLVRGDFVYLQATDGLSAINRPQYLAVSHEINQNNAQIQQLKKDLDKVKGQNADEEKRLKDAITATQQTVDKLTQDLGGCTVWRKQYDEPYAMILAGDTLFVGGDRMVAGVATQTGKEEWRAETSGKTYGLSVANGRLFASTDAGTIECFAGDKVDRERVVAAQPAANPYPEDELTPVYAAAADAILAKSGVKKGYALVLGCNEGRLAYELAKQTELRIIGVERDADKVEKARRALDTAGLYGTRISVHHIKGETLPFTTYMANLIVSEEAMMHGRFSYAASEVNRVLRPYGGCLCIGHPDQKHVSKKLDRAGLEQWLAGGGIEAELTEEGSLWALSRRGPVEGAGEWTQLYADSRHTACSMDALQGPMAIQWFGEPGPRDMVDRHHRPMSSLFKDGRLFIPANDKVICVDPYNGTTLWSLDVPNSRRIGAMKNCGQMVLGDQSLYVAVQDKCWVLNVETGARVSELTCPKPGDDPQDWGYLDVAGDHLIGTGQVPGASFDQHTWDTCDLLEGDNRPVIVSQNLFSVNRHSGKKEWVHKGGAILNSGIAIDEGRIFFVECRNDELKKDEDGRVRLKDFNARDTFLVALDLENGRKRWETPVTFPFQHIMYVNGANGTLLVTGTYNEQEKVFYGLYGFGMADGIQKWHAPYRALDIRGNDFAGTEGSHGEQWQHPVIIGDTVYSRPFAFDLQTGQQRDYIARRGGHGCGGLTSSAHYLYGRGSNPRMYPTEEKETEGVALTLVSRPGCWLNIIPAGGLVMIPESSAGCTCGYPLQTSIVLAPQSVCGAGPSS